MLSLCLHDGSYRHGSSSWIQVSDNPIIIKVEFIFILRLVYSEFHAWCLKNSHMIRTVIFLSFSSILL